MKNILTLKTVALLAMFIFLVFTATSCLVVLESAKPGKGHKGNNGKHKGWNKGKGNKHGHSSATPWESVENSKNTFVNINWGIPIREKEASVKMAI